MGYHLAGPDPRSALQFSALGRHPDHGQAVPGWVGVGVWCIEPALDAGASRAGGTTDLARG